MNFKELTELIKLIDKSDLAEFKYKADNVDIQIRHNKYYKNATQISSGVQMMAAPSVQTVQSPSVSAPTFEKTESAPKVETASKLIEVKSPMVGTFYRSPGPDKSNFVSVGDSISAGSVLCIIEAMKLFNEIESEVSGKIVKVMVEDATPVEYDQVLFLVEP
jgi:acetyl-CoA carboxylase biotin carboxyl carrier protein